MLSKRGRTLSDEGVELFLDGMAVPPSRPCKNTIRKFLFSCFHSDWDDKIEKVTKSCRLSTMAMYGELWEDPRSLKTLPTSLDAGITNTVKLILSNDEGKVTKGSILKNYRFFLSIMEAAFKNNDHQTAMMMWLALTHSSVERLEFKRPKKAEKILQNVIDSYGTSNNCYNKHLLNILDSPVNAAVDYLPSLIACNVALGENDEFKKAFKAFGHHLNDETLTEIKNQIELISVMCFNYRGEKMKLYQKNISNGAELFEISNKIPSESKRILKRTKKQNSNTIKWQDNKMYGKNVPTIKTSKYVIN